MATRKDSDRFEVSGSFSYAGKPPKRSLLIALIVLGTMFAFLAAMV